LFGSPRSPLIMRLSLSIFLVFFTAPSPPVIYPLSLHDALPIYPLGNLDRPQDRRVVRRACVGDDAALAVLVRTLRPAATSSLHSFRLTLVEGQQEVLVRLGNILADDDLARGQHRRNGVGVARTAGDTTTPVELQRYRLDL